MCCQPPPPDRSRGREGPYLKLTRRSGTIMLGLLLLLIGGMMAQTTCTDGKAPPAPTAASTPVVLSAGGAPGGPNATPLPISLALKAPPTATPLPTVEPTPSPVPTRTGSVYPLAVMVENMSDARPQSGLARADIVYEALAEGGITRFLAIYVDGQAEAIGPVRSARHYFVYLADEFNASYVHIGWSPQAYDALQATGITDLDEIRGDPGFWRVSSRYAPHNAYTSTDLLRSTLDKVRRLSPGSLAGFKFEPIPKRPEGAEATEISLTYPGGYQAEYRYSASDRLYYRSMDGLPEEDADTGEPVAPRNLVVQFMRAWVIDDVGRLDMAQVGEGKALYFREGVVTEGSWRKSSYNDVTHWLDAEGKPVLMNPGKTWVQIIPPGSKISY